MAKQFYNCLPAGAQFVWLSINARTGVDRPGWLVGWLAKSANAESKRRCPKAESTIKYWQRNNNTKSIPIKWKAVRTFVPFLPHPFCTSLSHSLSSRRTLCILFIYAGGSEAGSFFLMLQHFAAPTALQLSFSLCFGWQTSLMWAWKITTKIFYAHNQSAETRHWGGGQIRMCQKKYVHINGPHTMAYLQYIYYA